MGTSLDDPRFNLIRHLEKSMEDADADIFDDETTVPRRKKKRRSSGRRVSFADHHNTIHIFARDDDYASPGDGKSRVLASERNPAGSPRRSPRIMARKRRSLDGYAESQPSVTVGQDEVLDQEFHDPDGDLFCGEIGHEPGPVDTRHIMQGNGELLLCDEDITLDSSTFTNLFGILKEETPLSQVQPSLDGSMSIATVAPFPRRTLPQEPEDTSSDMSLTIQCFRRRTALAKARLEFSEERQQSIIREPLKQLNGPQSPDERIQRGKIAQKLFCPQSSPLGVKCTGIEHAAAVPSMEFVNDQAKCRKPDAAILDFIIQRHEVASELTPASLNGTGAIAKEDVAPDSVNGAEDMKLETTINPVYLQNVTCNSLDNELTKDTMDKAMKKTQIMHLTTVNIEAKVDKTTHATDVAVLSDFADKRSQSRYHTCSKVNADLCQSNEDSDMALEKGAYTNNLSGAYVLEIKDKEIGQTQTMDVPRLAELLDRETEITHVQFQMCPPDGDASQCSGDEDMAMEQTVYTSRDAGVFDRKHKETSQTKTRHMPMLMEPVDREPEVAELQFQLHPKSGDSNDEDMELEMTRTRPLDKKPEIAQVHHRLWPNTDTSQCNEYMAQEPILHTNKSLNACVLDFKDKETCRTQTMHVPTLASLLDREAETTQCPGNRETSQCCEEDMALEKIVDNNNLDSSSLSPGGRKTSGTQTLHGEKLADMLDREAEVAQANADLSLYNDNMALEKVVYTNYLSGTYVSEIKDKMKAQTQAMDVSDLLDRETEITHMQFQMCPPDGDASQCSEEEDMALEQTVYTSTDAGKHKETSQTKIMHMRMLTEPMDREPEVAQLQFQLCPANRDSDEEDMELEMTHTSKFSFDAYVLGTRQRETSPMQKPHLPTLSGQLDKKTEIAQVHRPLWPNRDTSQCNKDMAVEQIWHTNNSLDACVLDFKDKETSKTQTIHVPTLASLLDREAEITQVFELCSANTGTSQCCEEDMELEKTVGISNLDSSPLSHEDNKTSQTQALHGEMLADMLDRKAVAAQCPASHHKLEQTVNMSRLLDKEQDAQASISAKVTGLTYYPNEDATKCKNEACALDFKDKETCQTQAMHVPTLANLLDREAEITHVKFELLSMRRDSTERSECSEEDMELEQTVDISSFSDSSLLGIEKRTSGARTLHVEVLGDMLDREAECPANEDTSQEVMASEQTADMNNLLVEEQNVQASMLDKVPEGESDGEEDMMLEQTEEMRSLTTGNFKYLENDHEAEEDMIFEEAPYASSLERDFNCLESIQQANICQNQSGGDTTTTLIPTLMGLLEREGECTSFTGITMRAGYVEAQPSATQMNRLCSRIQSTSKYRDMPKSADSEGLDQLKCEGTHAFKTKGISSTLVSHEHVGPHLAVTKDSGTPPATTCLNRLLDSKGPSTLSYCRESEKQNEATVGRGEGTHVFQSPTTTYKQRMVTQPYNATSMKVPESTQQIEDKQAVSTLLKKCMELRQLSEKKKLDIPMQNLKDKQQVQDNHVSLEQLLKLVDVKNMRQKANVDKHNLSTESCLIQSTYESLNYVHLTAPLISIMLDRKKQLEAAIANLRLSLTQKTSRLSPQNSAVSLSVEQVRGKKLLELQALINEKTGQLRLGQKDLLTWKLGVETEKLCMLQKNKSSLLKEMEAMHGNIRQVHKQVHHDHYKLREDNRHINELHEKEKAMQQSLLMLKQKLGSMQRRIREIKSDSGKMPHHSNPSVGCIMRKHRLLHYLQGWNIKDIVKQQNGHLIEIDYRGLVKQCLILQGNGSAVHVWSKLSPCLQSIEMAFPHLNASLPFQVILPRTDKCRIGHAKELPAALQQTNNVISSLLQLLDDVRKCRVGFRWLNAVGFSRSSENNICLAFAFATASRKLEITFGLDCLSSGLYPADILPSTVSLSTRSRKDAVTEHTIHKAMDNVPHGFCRFQRLCRSISRVLES